MAFLAYTSCDPRYDFGCYLLVVGVNVVPVVLLTSILVEESFQMNEE